MNKYSPTEIKMMAVKFQQAMQAGDPRCVMLLMMLSMATNNSERDCLNKIALLAAGKPV